MQISSESVKVGHPDLVADIIAANVIAAILDEEKKQKLTLANMPHCGIEVFLGKGICIVGGEVRTRVYVDIDKVARDSVIELGYNHAAVGLNGHLMGVLNAIIPQSPDINQGTSCLLNKDREIGAGDQGIMYGFACDETPEMLPLPYVMVNKLMRAFEYCQDPIFAPDGKGQVSIDYDAKTGKPLRVAKVLMSNSIDYRFVKGSRLKIRDRAKKIAFDALEDCVDKKTEFLFNPTGEWNAINSCSAADSGVTGRKLVVQFYGGFPGAQLGGGAVVNKTRRRLTVQRLLARAMLPRISWPQGLRPNVLSSWPTPSVLPIPFPFTSTHSVPEKFLMRNWGKIIAKNFGFNAGRHDREIRSAQRKYIQKNPAHILYG